MENWEDNIKKTTLQFKDHFTDLSLAQLNWKPNENTWSIAQHIDHLIVINRSYFPVIKAVKSDNHRLPFIAKFDVIVNFMGREILKSVQPERAKKIKTFPIWEPEAGDLSHDILERFAMHQEELLRFIKETKESLPLDTVISSPANKNLVYKLKTAFDIIVTHEQRHLNHALSVKGALESN